MRLQTRPILGKPISQKNPNPEFPLHSWKQEEEEEAGMMLAAQEKIDTEVVM
jgi:hypothetical protein